MGQLVRRALIALIVAFTAAAALFVFVWILRDQGWIAGPRASAQLQIARDIDGLYPDLETVVGLAETDLDLAKALVTISVVTARDFIGEKVDVAELLAKINSIRADAARIRFDNDPAEIRLDLLRLFDHDLRIGPCSDGKNCFRHSVVLLQQILENRIGNCIGLSALYITALDGLAPVYGVFARTHIFVRYDDGRRQINLDPTSRMLPEVELADAMYMDYFSLSAQSSLMMRNMTKKEFISSYLVSIGASLLDDRKFASAVRVLGFARQAAPSNPLPSFKLGELNLITGKHAEAEVYFLSGLKVDAGNDMAWNNLGTVYLSMEKNEQAISSFKKALDLNPSYERAYLNLGLAYLATGDRASARDSWLTALRLNSDSPAEKFLQQLNSGPAGKS